MQEKRRLSRPVRPDESDGLAVRDPERNAAKGGRPVGIGVLQVFRFDDMVAHGSTFIRAFPARVDTL